MKQNTKSFEVRQLTHKDLPTFKLLVDMFNVVFEEEERAMGSDAHLLKLLGSGGFVAFAAVSEQDVAGGLTAYELPMCYADRSEILLYDMAVKPEYQRMGIGRALIQNLKGYCASHAIEEFFVMAHEEDAHALEFYRATGGKSEKVINFLYAANEK